jgi:hypothetical protein
MLVRNRFELILVIAVATSSVLTLVIQLTPLHAIPLLFWVWVISSDSLGVELLVCLGYLWWRHRKAKRLNQEMREGEGNDG